jgi:tetratricopeptide (TPR) repeat protein
MNIKLLSALLAIFLAVLISYSLPSQSEDNNSLLQKGISSLMKKKSIEAVKFLDQALQQNPNLIDAYIHRGNAKRLLGNPQMAINDYNSALKLNPLSISANVQLALAYKELRNSQLYANFYQKALEIKPISSDDYRELGDLILWSNPDGALKYLNQAIAIDNKNARAYSSRILANDQNHDQIISDFEKLLDLEPNAVDRNSIYNQIAMECVFSGNFNKGIFYYRKLLKIAQDKNDLERAKDLSAKINDLQEIESERRALSTNILSSSLTLSGFFTTIYLYRRMQLRKHLKS